jgi:CDP-diacylglycerol--serine O-phosphatidyltransferase
MRKKNIETLKRLKHLNVPSRTRLHDLSISRMLPNIATVIALCTGLSSIRFVLLGRYEYALGAVIVAAFFDAMDGRLARLLRASSDFGAELDSLSDFISFGVAPAIIMYLISLNHLGGIGWGMSLIFAVCIGLRLARFNTNIRSTAYTNQPSWKKNFFTGVPAPASAFIALFPLSIYLTTQQVLFLSPFFCSLFLVGAGMLAISRFPTYSFKNTQIPRKMVPLTMLFVGGAVAALLTDIWMTFSLLVLAYLGLLPFSYKKYQYYLKYPPENIKQTSSIEKNLL